MARDIAVRDTHDRQADLARGAARTAARAAGLPPAVWTPADTSTLIAHGREAVRTAEQRAAEARVADVATTQIYVGDASAGHARPVDRPRAQLAELLTEHRVRAGMDPVARAAEDADHEQARAAQRSDADAMLADRLRPDPDRAARRAEAEPTDARSRLARAVEDAVAAGHRRVARREEAAQQARRNDEDYHRRMLRGGPRHDIGGPGLGR